ncbi:purine-nucleoside phosphorylase [Paenibacillus planticolens]|uniref:Purine nucleoside phosphorylase n=1 Tax=Paenibacillus planticolens TaxID=2654976 RepID=A0ABX1ZJ07_9BACL|nr:purine-nucleoside phosphorylase [Paenibacillus planticolens]NOU99815.1 purine-nucleoside phosphorylase [Paenibacillus planticolens]
MNNTKILEAAVHILPLITNIRPSVGLILGSGLGALADEIVNGVSIPYEDIPHFPVSTVEGHAGRLVIGELMGKQVVAMQGRFHYYEGYSQEKITYPVRVMKALGVRQMIVTNAAGALHTGLHQGQLMIINDHLNFAFDNPLIGPNDPHLGVRFPDMSRPYAPKLIELAKKIALKQELTIAEGVYAMMSGPTYETPAEIRMLRKLGGDAVGMSTVPEVIAARHSGIDVLGISCITNMAAGILPQPLSHDEVMETAAQVKSSFLRYMKEIIANL